MTKNKYLEKIAELYELEPGIRYNPETDNLHVSNDRYKKMVTTGTIKRTAGVSTGLAAVLGAIPLALTADDMMSNHSGRPIPWKRVGKFSAGLAAVGALGGITLGAATRKDPSNMDIAYKNELSNVIKKHTLKINSIQSDYFKNKNKYH